MGELSNPMARYLQVPVTIEVGAEYSEFVPCLGYRLVGYKAISNSNAAFLGFACDVTGDVDETDSGAVVDCIAHNFVGEIIHLTNPEDGVYNLLVGEGTNQGLICPCARLALVAGVDAGGWDGMQVIADDPVEGVLIFELIRGG